MHVGIVGAGQLGRMLALAGYPIGVRCLFLDRSSDTPGAQVAPSLIGDLEDAAQLAELARRSDVVTFDWENISGSALEPLEKITQVRPPRAALEISQDRLQEKALFTRLKIPVAEHAPIDSREQLAQAARAIGLPGVLKTRRLGYDGKGQFVLRAMADIDGAAPMSDGSGFFYRLDGQTYLLTARHCFSAKHMETGEYLGSYSTEPTHVRVCLRKKPPSAGFPRRSGERTEWCNAAPAARSRESRNALRPETDCLAMRA